MQAVRVFLLHENCDTARGGCYQYNSFCFSGGSPVTNNHSEKRK
nr:MAG TPA: hypothetical protein [Caudoviricetes sp.]